MTYNDMNREDYTDPACPLCLPDKDGKQVKTVPVRRILEKADRYYAMNDPKSAERLLFYWLDEARLEGDLRGKVTLECELMGLFRKAGDREKALAFADAALSTAKEADLSDTVTMGTVLVNSATVYKAFGDAARALPLYVEALTLYEKYLDENDDRLGGLCNNMALSLTDLKEYEKAFTFFRRALNIMSENEGAEPEIAVTYLNMANCAEAWKGLENAEDEINSYLDKAEENLDSPAPARDGNYAFVCEKCSHGFEYYGRFMYASKLKKISEEIYGENRRRS